MKGHSQAIREYELLETYRSALRERLFDLYAEKFVRSRHGLFKDIAIIDDIKRNAMLAECISLNEYLDTNKPAYEAAKQTKTARHKSRTVGHSKCA
jgi:hypothetical protein